MQATERHLRGLFKHALPPGIILGLARCSDLPIAPLAVAIGTRLAQEVSARRLTAEGLLKLLRDEAEALPLSLDNDAPLVAEERFRHLTLSSLRAPIETIARSNLSCLLDHVRSVNRTWIGHRTMDSLDSAYRLERGSPLNGACCVICGHAQPAVRDPTKAEKQKRLRDQRDDDDEYPSAPPQRSPPPCLSAAAPYEDFLLAVCRSHKAAGHCDKCDPASAPVSASGAGLRCVIPRVLTFLLQLITCSLARTHADVWVWCLLLSTVGRAVCHKLLPYLSSAPESWPLCNVVWKDPPPSLAELLIFACFYAGGLVASSYGASHDAGAGSFIRLPSLQIRSVWHLHTYGRFRLLLEERTAGKAK